MKYLKAVVLVVVVVCVGFVGFLTWMTRDQVVHHVSDWDSFYAEKVQRSFKLPQEAAIVEAREVYSFPMGYTITVNFRLPQTKTPEVWVKSIAKASRMEVRRDSTYRLWRSHYKIERQEGDYKRVEYLAESKIYEVHYDWD